jgi:hypothetical protein
VLSTSVLVNVSDEELLIELTGMSFTTTSCADFTHSSWEVFWVEEQGRATKPGGSPGACALHETYPGTVLGHGSTKFATTMHTSNRKVARATKVRMVRKVFIAKFLS